MGKALTAIICGFALVVFCLSIIQPFRGLPISVEIREGLLSHGVFVIKNLSDIPVRGRIHFERNLNRKQAVDYPFVMDAFATNEFGRLELNGDGLEKGDCGFIKIDGYSRIIGFEIFDKQWFHCERVSGLGLDIPVFRRQESGFGDRIGN